MAFGILQNLSARDVPGTSQLERNDTSHSSASRHAKGTASEVTLIPQPTHDPNDPLNWPLWQRDLILLLLSYCTNICVGGIGPLVATIAQPIVQEYHVGYKQVSLLTGYQLAVVGAVAPIVSSLSWKFGKRPVYLVSVAFLLAGSVVCTFASSYDMLLGGRLLQGFGTAAFESITFSAVGDLYFVHQRGLRMSLYVMSAVGMVLFPSLVAGVIATSLTWRWSFGILSIFIGVATLGIVLFGWETSYDRSNVSATPQNGTQQSVQSDGRAISCEDKAELQEVDQASMSHGVSKERQSFVERMKPCSGVDKTKSLLRLTILPFTLIANPAVCWAVVLNAFAQLWNVAVSLVLAQMFSPAPYSMNPAQLGYLNAGPIVAGLVSSLVCGMLSDQIVRVMSKKNNGIYEPEFRLVLIAAAPVFSSIGYFLFGHLSKQGSSPVLISFVWSLAFVSAQIIGTATGAYIVDAYRELDIDIFVLSMSLKNFLFFGASFFINDWITLWGPNRVFQCIGGIMLGLSATTTPVYLYGKRLRAWWYKV